ncbi:hypothetical protein AcW1_001958 [Taiwanofungus camphoratus]|nr:hypothetical protein AcV5_009954 [Antrodia cinnamomea]KAI0944198.1 hypothetical protein AcW1_001958 [Antrodia cinnamomea]
MYRSVILFLITCASLLVSAANVGDATYYNPGTGACGGTNTGADLVVAVSTQFYNTYPGATVNPNNNPICRTKITANYQGKSVTAAVVDKCYSCALDDIDLSPSAFSVLADLSVGRLEGVTWTIS